ncbi:MAG: hypothetical protein HY716_16460 [Planctomycetes bacterium]|nr:hypothetical protein [Planctomycetota bacterium]
MSDRPLILEEIPGPWRSAADEAARNELKRMAWEALERMPVRLRCVIVLRLSGWSFDEIAWKLKISSACTRRRFHDGIAILKRRFRPAA